MSELREKILGDVPVVDSQLDVPRFLEALAAIELAIAEARRILVSAGGPVEDAEGRCLHPEAERGLVGTFRDTKAFCRRCGDFLP